MKAHMGIPGNERADERAKFYTRVMGPEVLTEGRIKRPGGRQNVLRWDGVTGEWRGAAGRQPLDTPVSGRSEWLASRIGKADREECRWCGGWGTTSSSSVETKSEKGAEVEHVGGLERQEVDCPGPKVRGREGEMEEWDLVEEFSCRFLRFSSFVGFNLSFLWAHHLILLISYRSGGHA